MTGMGSGGANLSQEEEERGVEFHVDTEVLSEERGLTRVPVVLHNR